MSGQVFLANECPRVLYICSKKAGKVLPGQRELQACGVDNWVDKEVKKVNLG